MAAVKIDVKKPGWCNLRWFLAFMRKMGIAVIAWCFSFSVGSKVLNISRWIQMLNSEYHFSKSYMNIYVLSYIKVKSYSKITKTFKVRGVLRGLHWSLGLGRYRLWSRWQYDGLLWCEHHNHNYNPHPWCHHYNFCHHDHHQQEFHDNVGNILEDFDV